MPSAKSYVIVDCEQSLLSDPFFYLPLLALFAEDRNKISPSPGSIANIFYKQYQTNALTLQLLRCFLKAYRHELSQWINAQDRGFPPFNSLIRLKDRSLLEYIIKLYEQSGEPITIVTSCLHKKLLSDCLVHILPQGSFKVRYAPLLDNIKETVSAIKVFTITPATEPPPGYSLLINTTRPSPKGGWQNYAAELELRLLNTDYFCDLREEQQQSVTITATPQKSSLLYSDKERSFSPCLFKIHPAEKVATIEDQIKRTQSPTVRRIIGDAITGLSSPPSSPLRSSSPAFSPGPSRRPLRVS